MVRITAANASTFCCRLDMPKNNIWNLKMSTGEDALKREDVQN